ncbi:hypothetical protein BpHYR1_029806 [Brachionus plicatilis]|uniref:Uncharacterized protein n=1 Tax=Brachionus plicatilis TaxID=10195 RepID=A0A3M7P2H1_BRAPC|nr:hypothetical protein BpHYR1_029806 [Brachionus plicatilis]
MFTFPNFLLIEVISFHLIRNFFEVVGLFSTIAFLHKKFICLLFSFTIIENIEVPKLLISGQNYYYNYNNKKNNPNIFNDNGREANK